MNENIKVYDWVRMFYSENIPIIYIGEIALRTIIMFLILIVALKFLSKRGVKQLSVFELAILIALGSAAGDPMFYTNVPILYGIAVIIVVILLNVVVGCSRKQSTLKKRCGKGSRIFVSCFDSCKNWI